MGILNGLIGAAVIMFGQAGLGRGLGSADSTGVKHLLTDILFNL